MNSADGVRRSFTFIRSETDVKASYANSDAQKNPAQQGHEFASVLSGVSDSTSTENAGKSPSPSGVRSLQRNMMTSYSSQNDDALTPKAGNTQSVGAAAVPEQGPSLIQEKLSSSLDQLPFTSDVSSDVIKAQVQASVQTEAENQSLADYSSHDRTHDLTHRQLNTFGTIMKDSNEITDGGHPKIPTNSTKDKKDLTLAPRLAGKIDKKSLADRDTKDVSKAFVADTTSPIIDKSLLPEGVLTSGILINEADSKTLKRRSPLEQKTQSSDQLMGMPSFIGPAPVLSGGQPLTSVTEANGLSREATMTTAGHEIQTGIDEIGTNVSSHAGHELSSLGSNSVASIVGTLSKETHFSPSPEPSAVHQIIDKVVDSLAPTHSPDISQGLLVTGAASDNTDNNISSPQNSKNISSGNVDVIQSQKATQKLTVLNFNLVPEGLGSVNIKLRLSGSNLHLEMNLSSSETVRMIDRDKDALTERLAATGYTLDTVNIKLHESFPNGSSTGSMTDNGAYHSNHGAAFGGEQAFGSNASPFAKGGQPSEHRESRKAGDKQKNMEGNETTLAPRRTDGLYL
ncbi:flagellar hook-length control protein FliK [Beijerinckia indica]|uniref:Flagellar hook-length control protein-like C-terminal domain-containing protein n=1 Tax=Beijerinckia indica subsp. indica (strain ATCC 9039 / DSM 1715 / NCIMB 8712) TaxID=395963 RepID=B2IJE4_BEII9|nr:flagellar hook-length control protein FliK [Beijerinckia indica]ACB96257.1 hypothetical protein Bind_2685 [Beijerinckia indica subsp. indica ATCC 9039]